MTQRDRVLIALTRDNVPRTARNIAVETGLPQASVRRILHELRLAPASAPAHRMLPRRPSILDRFRPAA